MPRKDDEPPACEVGRVLEQILKDKKWSKSRLAEYVKIDPGQISKYWKGERTPEPERIEQWARMPDLEVYADRLRTARRADEDHWREVREREAKLRVAEPATPYDPDDPAIPTEHVGAPPPHLYSYLLVAFKNVQDQAERAALEELLETLARRPDIAASLLVAAAAVLKQEKLKQSTPPRKATSQ